MRPSPDYMSLINQSLTGGPAPTAPVMLGALPAAPPADAPPAPYTAGPAPAAYFAPPADAAPAPPPMAAPTATPPQPAGPLPFMQQVSPGGVVNVPGREVDLRGPTLRAAQADSNAATSQAIADIEARTQAAIEQDYAAAEAQARRAAIREDVAERAAAARAEEAQHRQAEFDDSVKAISQQSSEPGRFWANASTGAKIAAVLTAGVGGFVSASRGGSNVGLDVVNTMIDRDVKAQEFAYNASRDAANAKQTAFSMAMTKYQNADAARAAARAAAQDATAAMLAKQAVLWKGTEAANKAQAALVDLQKQREQQIQHGVAYAAPKQVAVGPQYVDTRNNLPYSQAEVKTMQAKADERDFKRDEQAADVAGKIMIAGAKDGGEGEKDTRARWVPTSSTGKGYFAPTEKEAIEHRDQQASTQEVIDLVDRIKASSAKVGYTGRVAAGLGLPGSHDKDARSLMADSTMLIGALNRAQKFGALDKGSKDLLEQLTGDPFSVRGNAANLDAARLASVEKRRQLEKSATGEKPTTTPASFKPDAKGK